jgi:hypothetical protein
MKTISRKLQIYCWKVWTFRDIPWVIELAFFLFGASNVFPLILNHGFTSIACLGNQKDGFPICLKSHLSPLYALWLYPQLSGNLDHFSLAVIRADVFINCAVSFLCAGSKSFGADFPPIILQFTTQKFCVDWIAGIISIHLIPVTAWIVISWPLAEIAE